MSENFIGNWTNEYGSILRIEEIENNQLRGKFLTKVGRQETKASWENVWFEVIGFINGPLISYALRSQGALNAHVGRLCIENGKETIRTKGYFITDMPEDQQWRDTAATSLVYTRNE